VIFWVVTTWNLIGGYRRFVTTGCLHVQCNVKAYRNVCKNQ
jgi:hypothetical protein